jgi:hypothetical protein
MDIRAVGYALAAMLAVPIVLTLPPRSSIRTILYPRPLALWALSYLSPKPSFLSTPSEQNHFGVQLVPWGIRILDRMYLNDPEQTFRRRDQENEKKQARPERSDRVQKFLWSLELITVTRGVGWNWDVTLRNPGKCQDRPSFTRKRIHKILLIVLLLVAFGLLSDYIVSCEATLRSWQRSGILLAGLVSLSLRLYIWIGYGIVTYASLTLPHDIMSVIFVGTGIGGSWAEPASWPPTFGDPLDAYSFRPFWG